jgi:hypothetical protein
VDLIFAGEHVGSGIWSDVFLMMMPDTQGWMYYEKSEMMAGWFLCS